MKSSGVWTGPNKKKKKRHRNAFSLSRRVILQATLKPEHHNVSIKWFILDMFLHYFLQWKHYAGQDTGQQVIFIFFLFILFYLPH